MDYEEQNKELMLLGASDAAEVENSPEKVQEKKRQRKEEVKEVVAKQLSLMASSLEEVCRDQWNS